MDQRARGGLVERGASRYDPVCEAITAKSGKPHQVDILCIVAMPQMTHQAAKCSRRVGVIKSIKRIV